GEAWRGKSWAPLHVPIHKLAQEEGVRLDRMGQLARGLDQILNEARRGAEAAVRASDHSSHEAQRAAQAMGQVLERMNGSAQVLQRILDQQQRVAGAHAGVGVLDAVEALRDDAQALAERRRVAPSAGPEVFPQAPPVSES